MLPVAEKDDRVIAFGNLYVIAVYDLNSDFNLNPYIGREVYVGDRYRGYFLSKQPWPFNTLSLVGHMKEWERFEITPISEREVIVTRGDMKLGYKVGYGTMTLFSHDPKSIFSDHDADERCSIFELDISKQGFYRFKFCTCFDVPRRKKSLNDMVYEYHNKKGSFDELDKLFDTDVYVAIKNNSSYPGYIDDMYINLTLTLVEN